MQENNPISVPFVTTPQAMEQPKQSNFLIILLSVLLFISVSIAGFFAYQTQKLVNELTVLKTQASPIATESSEVDPTANWKTYMNNELKFSIKYPGDLDLSPEIIDMKRMQLDYKTYCKTHECGGSRWPDEIIAFRRKDGTTAFGVQIFNVLVSETFGGTEKDGKTFVAGIVGGLIGMESIKMVPLEDNLLDKISKTLKIL